MAIKILPKEVASKIAAGEVVERPVSVIKELVENSIDAGATEITINVQKAGRKRIEVTDNGIGISSADAEIAVKRYATSKISTISDLNKIKTLGFRGEALASISAVSRFTLESRTKGKQIGFLCIIEGGEMRETKETGKPVGTKITVDDLFFNVPARLKFLKKDVTERRLINQVVSRYALYYVNVRFSLFQDGKRVLATNGNGNRREVLSALFDIETSKQLLTVNYADEYVKIEGFTSPHTLTRASRRDIYFFVNGRLVSESTISSAITKGYYGLMMVGRFPITILFIGISPEELDVNVHPTKTEIRLKDSSRVFSAIQRAVRKTISAFSPYPVMPPAVWVSTGSASNENVMAAYPRSEQSIIPESDSFLESGNRRYPAPLLNIPLLRLIGQIGRTYVAAEGPDGLYLIDQHAAHERILYEQLIDSEVINHSQMLLEPRVITVSGLNLEEIQNSIKMMCSIGFEIEPFGPDTYKITGVPQILSAYDPNEAFLSAVNSDEERMGGLVESEQKNALVTRICKRLAIKAGQSLSITEQEKLIRDLESCQNPRTCPHGRPTMIHISVDSLDRQFGRKGSI